MENPILSKIKNSEVYLSIPGEEIVLKSIPGNGYFLKPKGGKEYKSDFSKNPLILEGIYGGEEISKNEYENY